MGGLLVDIGPDRDGILGLMGADSMLLAASCSPAKMSSTSRQCLLIKPCDSAPSFDGGKQMKNVLIPDQSLNHTISATTNTPTQNAKVVINTNAKW